MIALRVNGGRVHVEQPRSDARRRTRCGLNLSRILTEAELGGQPVEEVDGEASDPRDRCRKCFPGTGRPARPDPDTDDLPVDALDPHAVAPVPMPTDARTVDVLTGQLDAWWEKLEPGQKMSAMLAAVNARP